MRNSRAPQVGNQDTAPAKTGCFALIPPCSQSQPTLNNSANTHELVRRSWYVGYYTICAKCRFRAPFFPAPMTDKRMSRVSGHVCTRHAHFLPLSLSVEDGTSSHGTGCLSPPVLSSSFPLPTPPLRIASASRHRLRLLGVPEHVPPPPNRTRQTRGPATTVSAPCCEGGEGIGSVVHLAA